MLVSLDKNKWLYDWMRDRFYKDLLSIIVGFDDSVPRPHKMREGIAKILTAHGYKTKLTRKFDVIISMSEKEYTFLKLKYE
jgi:hypothetical protein